jgi:chloramphenicol-sensitive protein RarD
MITDEHRRETRRGIGFALAAFAAWGLAAPLHFKLLGGVPATEILSHRVVWALLLVLALVAAARRWAELRRLLARPRDVLLLGCSALLVGGNWLLYIWAVNDGRLVETSLGYFINPLVNVALGMLFLGERLGPRQLAACGLAAAGVLALAVAAGAPPWVSLALAFSFGFYGLIRKKVRVDPLTGLLVESAALAPLAVAWLLVLAARGEASFGADWRLDLLLAATGVTTALPLIWFAAAAQRLKLSTLGLLQYMAPSLQLALGVLVYRETFTGAHALAFAAIWAALALYSYAALGPAWRARASAQRSS